MVHYLFQQMLALILNRAISGDHLYTSTTFTQMQDNVSHLNSVFKYVKSTSTQVQSAELHCEEPTQGMHSQTAMTVAKRQSITSCSAIVHGTKTFTTPTKWQTIFKRYCTSIALNRSDEDTVEPG